MQPIIGTPQQIHVPEKALRTDASLDDVFDLVVFLGWHDGPVFGLLRLSGASEFVFKMVDDADQFRFRVFSLAPLPTGSVDDFIRLAQRYGVQTGAPPKPLWIPMWSFKNESDRAKVDGETNQIVGRTASPVGAFCLDLDGPKIIAYRQIVAEPPTDWFDWLGMTRPNCED